MLILGILLIAVALVVFGYMFFGTSDLAPMDIDLGIFTVQLTPLHLYLLGAATLVVLTLGLLTLVAGLRASRRRRREVKELRKAVHDGGTGEDRDLRETTGYEREIATPVDSRTGRTRDDARVDERLSTSPPGAGPRADIGEPAPTDRSPDDAHIALPSDYPSDAPPPDGPRRS